ncbi:hypothetical protein MGA5115_01951 [Marinomonas gallaica]|uniref:Uncharacterized protein n=1 Tax=Marinomonas gallaica TaxID=1806667 RepID=A0A1C3JRU1_9GAMM|nr:hypothetical protein MGA5115_01951 [Marinomonas gallaica]SBT20161.1 hypothetical protein MGA5116_00744 [Marinomonas gallaica]
MIFLILALFLVISIYSFKRAYNERNYIFGENKPEHSQKIIYSYYFGLPIGLPTGYLYQLNILEWTLIVIFITAFFYFLISTILFLKHKATDSQSDK